jgi:hypothetical protein
VSDGAQPSSLSHEQAWDLIPWLANGRLGAAESAALRAHLEGCAACTREVAQQRRVFEGMQADDGIAFASEAAFQKLAARIDAPPSAARAAVFVRWVAATGLAAMFALVLWAGGWLQRPPGSAAPRAYQTLTAPPAAVPVGARLRVVFAPDLKLDQLERTLRSIDASISNGPSEAGVFTLTLPRASSSPTELARRLEALRADPGVRFAEPVGTAR